MEDYHRNKHFEFGTSNPSLMEKPFWKYMVSNPHLTGYDARKLDKDTDEYSQLDRARWCFARFGTTQTFLPDGRLIQIGGEHEDGYDSDFQIYNDVVVIKNPHITRGYSHYTLPVPSNFPLTQEQKAKLWKSPMLGTSSEMMLGTSNASDVTIYGYPKEVFPPTDRHTATYVKDNKDEFIYIIGGLGYTYSSHRRKTHVYRLRLSDFVIDEIFTSGSGPMGCTEGHKATLIKEMGQKEIEISTGDNGIYRLDIKTKVWKTIKARFINHTEPGYPRCEFEKPYMNSNSEKNEKLYESTCCVS